jgi:hypothetical protein
MLRIAYYMKVSGLRYRWLTVLPFFSIIFILTYILPPFILFFIIIIIIISPLLTLTGLSLEILIYRVSSPNAIEAIPTSKTQ